MDVLKLKFLSCVSFYKTLWMEEESHDLTSAPSSPEPDYCRRISVSFEIHAASICLLGFISESNTIINKKIFLHLCAIFHSFSEETESFSQ